MLRKITQKLVKSKLPGSLKLSFDLRTHHGFLVQKEKEADRHRVKHEVSQDNSEISGAVRRRWGASITTTPLKVSRVELKFIH